MHQGRESGVELTAAPPAHGLRLRSSSARIEDAPIFKITAAIADAVTAGEVYEALVDHVAEAVGASSAALWLVGRDGQATLVRSRGYGAEAVEAMQVIDVRRPFSLPVADCIRTAAAIWIPSQAAVHEQYPHLRALSTSGRSYRVSCLPLGTHDRVLGSLCLTIEEAGEAAEEEREFLLLVARYATQGLERLRLYEAERLSRAEADAAAHRIDQLYRFAEAVVAADRVESVFVAAFDAIEGALGVSRAAILTLDEHEVMRFKAWRGLSDGYRAAVEGHSPWPPDATVPQPVLVGDALADPAWAPFAETFRGEGIGALAFFPLLARGRLLGKLMLYHDRPHRFSPLELETVRAIGYHLGSVVARFTAFAELEETVRCNELFAGVLAHDLRSPLSAIMMSSQRLARQADGSSSGETTAKSAATMLASGRRMEAMIGQLLDFTQSRSGGGIRIERRQTNLDEVYAQAVGELQLIRPHWTIRRERSGNLVGSWDAGRLVQVFSNLIANAGQHGPKDQPIVVRLDGRRDDRVSIEIHNLGSIPASVLPELFDPFRTTRQKRGQSSGLGLGLFIVREIVQAHQGTVEISSSEPAGTTVSIRLPR